MGRHHFVRRVYGSPYNYLPYIVLLYVGTVWVNDHITIVSEMPHGGYKQSGFGKDMSMYALEDYTQIKHVMTELHGKVYKDWHYMR